MPAAQAVAGDLLGRRPGAVGRLGVGRVAAMAQHPLAAVRSAAAAMLKSAAAEWQRDPSVLLVLADSDWPDTRLAALDLLDRYVVFDTLGFDGVVGLLDSNRTDVQDRGRQLAVRHIGRLDPVALVERLAQHPHPNMRLFALSLVTEHLPDGAEALAKVEPLCRSALFDVWPQAAAKSAVVALLRDRGQRDAAQAAVAVRILGSFVRVQGARDMERVLEAIVRIQLAQPEVVTAVKLPTELVAPNEPIARAAEAAPGDGIGSLPRYAGGGLGRGPDAQPARADDGRPPREPPPQPSPGVPGEGVKPASCEGSAAPNQPIAQPSVAASAAATASPNEPMAPATPPATKGGEP